MGETSKVILEGKNLSKEYNGNTVLKDVSIRCVAGIATAIVGENGAGKTTLMNILGGGLRPTSGMIEIDGREIHFANAQDAREHGIAFVHQELSLMREMTVGENIMLGREPRRGPFINQKELHRQAAALLKEIGYEIDVGRLVCDLSPAEQQITEIAKAWACAPRVMIFDEPTSSLSSVESGILFCFIRRIVAQSVAVILISHRMDDIFESCDDVVVLKDGEFVFSAATADITEGDLIRNMVGRELQNIYPPRNSGPAGEIRVSIRNASVGRKVKDVSFDVPVGSVIGIGGLEGQGQRELARALFGVEPFTSGEYLIDGKKVKISSPYAAVKRGIAFVPDDRKSDGLVLPLSVMDNMLALVQNKISSGGVIRGKAAAEEVSEGIRQLDIKTADFRQLVQYLSGGNQQKVVFSKWVKTNPKILYLHDPTRGVDVQSKLEIYELIRHLTGAGVSVVVFTSDMLELIGLSDEIYVMYEGEISGKVAGAEATEETIMKFSTRRSGPERNGSGGDGQ